MARGAVISPEVRRHIAEAALKTPHTQRRALVESLRNQIKAMGYPVPEVDTLLKMVSQARRSGRTKLDQPWSLGSLSEQELPSDTLPDILEIWRFCLAVGWTLTIRQAKWIARIRGTMPTDRDMLFIPEYWVSALYGEAERYARREQASEVLGILNDTSDLDAELFLTGAWEWQTAYMVGQIQPWWVRETALQSVHEKEQAIASSTAGRDGDPVGGWQMPHHVVESRLGMTEGEFDFNPSPEVSRVYAYWLRIVNEGPKWNALPFENRREIILRLQQEVSAVDAATKRYLDLQPQWLRRERAYKLWGAVAVTPKAGWTIGPGPGPVGPEFNPRTPPPVPGMAAQGYLVRSGLRRAEGLLPRYHSHSRDSSR